MMISRKSTFEINFGSFRISDESRFLAGFPIVAAMPDLDSRNFDYSPIAPSAIAALAAAGIRTYTVGAIKAGESGYDVHCVPVAVADHLAGMSPYQGALAALFERTMQIGYTELDEDEDT